jgi:hypothetical protein
MPGFISIDCKLDYGVHTKEEAIKLAEKASKELTPEVELTWEDEPEDSDYYVSVWGMSQDNYVIWKLFEEETDQ